VGRLEGLHGLLGLAPEFAVGPADSVPEFLEPLLHLLDVLVLVALLDDHVRHWLLL
jgi:hypothetical protein